MGLNKSAIQQHPPLILYLFMTGLGMYVGTETVNEFLLSALYFVIACACLFFFITENYKYFFTLLPYFAYSEIIIRDNEQFLPYSFSAYFYIIVFGIGILKMKTNIRLHSKAFVFLIFFVLIEYLNTFRSNNLEYARFLLANSTSLLIIVFWASSHIIDEKIINILFTHLRLAGIFLCGVILIAHLKGNIHYELESSAQASNGLAPVQISGYLGLVSILFFFAMMSGDNKNLILNIILFCFNTTLLLLTFSRGGLYFIIAVMLLYFAFNLKKSSTYKFSFLLITIAVIIYKFVSIETNGMIEQRYEEANTSGRVDLAKAAFTLLQEQPLAGIGTGNYINEIEKQSLYRFQSGAHNEFTRVAAEHGVLGIITYWGFYIYLFAEILRRKKIQRDYAIYFFVLFCMIIVHNGLKISIQPLILMLVVATPSYFVIKKRPESAAPKKLAGYAG